MLRDRIEPANLLLGQAEILVTTRGVPPRQIYEIGQCLERVLDLMCNRGSQPSRGRQPFIATERLFGALLCAYITRNCGRADQLAFFIAQGRNRKQNGETGSILVQPFRLIAAHALFAI